MYSTVLNAIHEYVYICMYTCMHVYTNVHVYVAHNYVNK